MVKLENDIIINLSGNTIEAYEESDFTMRDCVIYGGVPSFWRSPLLWLSLKILLWKHRGLRGPTDSAVYIHSSNQTAKVSE